MEELCRENYNDVYGYFIRRTGNETVTQNLTRAVFDRAWQEIPNFDLKSYSGTPILEWFWRLAGQELRKFRNGENGNSKD